MARVRRQCGTATVRPRTSGTDGDDGTGGTGSNGETTAAPSVPGIGPLTVDNPRALAAGFGGLGLAVALTR